MDDPPTWEYSYSLMNPMVIACVVNPHILAWAVSTVSTLYTARYRPLLAEKKGGRGPKLLAAVPQIGAGI